MKLRWRVLPMLVTASLLSVTLLFFIIPTNVASAHAYMKQDIKTVAAVHPKINTAPCAGRTDLFQVYSEGGEVCFANAGYTSYPLYDVQFVCTGKNHGYIWYAGDSGPTYYGWGVCTDNVGYTMLAVQIL